MYLISYTYIKLNIKWYRCVITLKADNCNINYVTVQLPSEIFPAFVLTKYIYFFPMQLFN